ncbi:MAG: putative Holliday junction resolvase [Candidatus Marivariicella framensis]|jgi:putative Holliday junction resolvase|tara:strand:+ start:1166 stop:1588 length:423 start_codon:yes stop_codon:yes gene_type:complete
MGCLIALDFGEKRTGIAHTDPFQIIASGITTLPPNETLIFLEQYVLKNDVEAIIVGQPKQKDGSFSNIETLIVKFIAKLQNKISNIKIIRYDERYTSKIASQVIIDSGIKKNKRKNKSLIDQISATIILQSYLEFKKLQK